MLSNHRLIVAGLNKFNNLSSTCSGFSLLEIVVSVAIFAVVLLFAEANYHTYLQFAAQRAASQVLLKNAEFMEKYYTIHGQYVAGKNWPILPFSIAPEVGASLYQIKLLPTRPRDVNSYGLIATPICGTLVEQLGCICADQDSNLTIKQNEACNNAGGICQCTN